MNNKDFLSATFNFLLDQAAAVWPTPKATQVLQTHVAHHILCQQIKHW